MSKSIPEQKTIILDLIEKNPEGLKRGEIKQLLSFSINDKTLQRRLYSLVEEGRLKRTGIIKSTRYCPVKSPSQENKGQKEPRSGEIFSKISNNVLKFLDSPPQFREPVSYKRDFIERYVPNETNYVPKDLRESLKLKGGRFGNNLAAGTYAQTIYQRLLVDLSFNSSRLEGNTYSKLDTQKLLDEGHAAEGKREEETVMILNHKEAIIYLVENAQEMELNSFTIFDLHSLLSQDLLYDPQVRGRIRTAQVSIGQSTYQPLGNGHLLRELFELILLKARDIKDPFEQSFFVLVHLSYLQGFVDVNKRTSRLACNIPFIKQNLCPLSFTDVPRDEYIQAHLAIYEKNEINPMLDLFGWAYIRSCQQYEVVTETLGELDPYRTKTRLQRKEVMGQVIRECIQGKEIENYIKGYCLKKSIPETEKFVSIVLTELSSLHEGAIIGLGVSVDQFNTWSNSQPGALIPTK